MEDVILKLIAEHRAALERMDAARCGELHEAARLLIDCFRAGGAVYICGNGGSAADAQHIAGELTGRYLRERNALNCIALTTNTSNLTAIANDYEFDRVFARQVEAHGRRGDVLWAISTSGKSANVLRAIDTAKNLNMKVLGFSGGAGGPMAALCDVCYRAPCETTYGIQQLHQLGYHIVCDLVERALSDGESS
jgi:D-sedoheptulose 7-phosphate isomerase